MAQQISINKKRKLARRAAIKTITEEAITNLSDYQPTPEETDLLNKGLSFVPHYKPILPYRGYIQTYRKHIYTAYHFRNQRPRDNPLKRNSNWQPPRPMNQALIQLEQDLAQHLHTTLHNQGNTHKTIHFKNAHILTTTDKTHLQAIRSLSQNKNITIKKADKGGSTVIMNTKDYIQTALTHLHQDNIYKETKTDKTKQLYDDIDSFILQMRSEGRITDTVANFIQPTSPPRTSLFYFLPKIHKPNNPPRPIISGIDSPTDQCSKFLTLILQPIAEAQPSYLRDTKHLLQIIRDNPTINQDTYLVTADVTSLYTNIPHDEGITTILTAIDEHRHLTPTFTPDNEIIKLILTFILKRNYFDFMDKHYKQTQGTAMGTKMAPPYANIYMSYFEKPLINTYTHNILLWKRYIDDILFLWRGTKQSLDQFIIHTNSLHPTIKLTFEVSKDKIDFLDTTIYRDKTNNTLQTTIYRKPTNKNLILHYSSKHPFHIKRSIIYSQALRYIRIISSQKNLQREISTLKNIFIARGYPLKLINQQVNKALTIPRHALLQDKPKTTTPSNKAPTFNIPYNPQNTFMKRSIRHIWQQALQDDQLKKIWTGPPKFTHQMGDKLIDTLVNARVPTQ